MPEQPAQNVDYLQQKILEKESQVKSPVLAAILGFFFPFFGYVYVRKYGTAVVILVINLMFILLSVIGIGIPFLLLYHIGNAYTCYRAADKANTEALRRIVTSK